MVRIDSVRSYDDFKGISRAIEECIDASSAASKVLQGSNRDTLVVVKPNWIQEGQEQGGGSVLPLLTSPEVVYWTVHKLAERMVKGGTIAICDAPHTYADFGRILEIGDLGSRLDNLQTQFPHLNIETLDLRREIWIRKDGVVADRFPNKEDPRGYARVNLAQRSFFYGHRGEGRYYGADYETSIVNSHHHGELQEYLLSGTAMASDLFVNLPKIKTHKKTGLTCALKNLVGINGDKNWLPHYILGSEPSGGDEYPESASLGGMESIAKRIGKGFSLRLPIIGPQIYRYARKAGLRVLGDSSKKIRNGNWFGNDTCWRMALDLNRALLWVDAQGRLNQDYRRPYLAIVDGIVSGEGDGPLNPQPAESNVIVSGECPALVDATVTRLMGFPISRLPIVNRAFDDIQFPIAAQGLSSIQVWDDRLGKEIPLLEVQTALSRSFIPHFGWPVLVE